MSEQSQTFRSFQDKWEQNQTLAFEQTLREGADIFNWILTRNGFPSVDNFSAWLSGRRRILDAGCGNGRVTALLDRYAPATARIVGIDLAAAHVARQNLAGNPRTEFHEGDLLGDLQGLGRFDLIYCQEVLHHTLDPKRAFLNLTTLLEDGGEIAIYVYKKKAPLREFADDMIRDAISPMAYEQAIEEMKQITELGRVLSELKLKVQIPEVRLLDIEAGEYDLQRFIYNFFLKCFWNPELSEEENFAINYDWYHPQLCSRHTRDEVEEWFKEAGLEILHSLVDPYGITVRGRRGATSDAPNA